MLKIPGMTGTARAHMAASDGTGQHFAVALS